MALADKRNETQEKLYYRFHPKLHMLLSLSKQRRRCWCWCSDESGARPWAPTTAVPCLWETQNCGPLQNIVKMTTRTTLVKSKQICVNAKS